MKFLQVGFSEQWPRIFSPVIPQQHFLGSVSGGLSHQSLCSATIASVGKIVIRSTAMRK